MAWELLRDRESVEFFYEKGGHGKERAEKAYKQFYLYSILFSDDFLTEYGLSFWKDPKKMARRLDEYALEKFMEKKAKEEREREI